MSVAILLQSKENNSVKILRYRIYAINAKQKVVIVVTKTKTEHRSLSEKKNHCLHQCKWCVLGNCFHHVLLILIINTFSFRQRNRYNIKIQRFLVFSPREIRCARGQDRPGNPLRYSSHVPSLFLQYLQSFFQAEIYIKFTFHKRYIWVRFLQDVVHV